MNTDINPNAAEAYYARGLAKVALGEYDAAIKDFNNAIDIYPKYAKPYYGRGLAKAKVSEKTAVSAP